MSRKNDMPSTANGEISPIDSIFIPQITDMHGIPFEETNDRGCGCGWRIDPDFGEGTYWYLPMNDSMALAVFDLYFYKSITFDATVPNFFCFGNYGHNMIPYFAPIVGVDEGWDRGTLLGYAWHKGECRQVAHAHERLNVASISMMPQAATEMAEHLGCDPIALTSAIASLDGTHRILPLLNLFDEIRETKPSKTVAKAYYECKATEACALLVDWWEQRMKDGAPRIRPADRTAFNLACAYARKNMDKPITLENLCHASCVSASKLASLFKSIEQVTPLQYVRNCRMERACELLCDTDAPLSDIAISVGFARQGSFSEAFKDRFGMTPHHYRRINRR